MTSGIGEDPNLLRVDNLRIKAANRCLDLEAKLAAAKEEIARAAGEVQRQKDLRMMEQSDHKRLIEQEGERCAREMADLICRGDYRSMRATSDWNPTDAELEKEIDEAVEELMQLWREQRSKK